MSITGEIAAIGGYYEQYKACAYFVYNGLLKNNLEFIELASDEVGILDDIQVVSNEVFGYQVKCSVKEDDKPSITYNYLFEGESSLISKIAKSWVLLKNKYPNKKINIGLITNRPISEYENILIGVRKISLSKFCSEFLDPIYLGHKKVNDFDVNWKEQIDKFKTETKLGINDLNSFLSDFKILTTDTLDEDFISNTKKTIYDNDIEDIIKYLFSKIGKEKKKLKVERIVLVNELKWHNRATSYFKQDFFVETKHYSPIHNSKTKIAQSIEAINKGYILLLGSPGSGKSTLITKWSDNSNDRILHYYLHIPEEEIIGNQRGESVYFLHDLSIQISQLNKNLKTLIPKDENDLVHLFKELIEDCKRIYDRTKQKTVIIIDGLDHIEREQNPKRSLLKILPLPDDIPDGIIFLLSSRYEHLSDLNATIKEHLNVNRKIQIESLSKDSTYTIINSYSKLNNYDDEIKEKIFLISEGHPLYLRYILEELDNSDIEPLQILEDKPKIYGNILTDYNLFWERIKANGELRNLLGLISRLRTSVNLNEIESNFGFEDSALIDFNKYVSQYFNKITNVNWQFFHNSFKFFLQEKTAQEILTNTASTKKDIEFHEKLSSICKNSTSNFQWEIIYHLYRSKQFSKINEITNSEYFRNQWIELRPLEQIEDDFKLAFKSSYLENDTLSLTRHLVAAHEIEQRNYNLQQTDLIDFYIKFDMIELATGLIINSNLLLVKKEFALYFCHCLIIKNRIKYSTTIERIYNLAKPNVNQSFDYTPGSMADELPLIKNWLSCAIYFEPIDELVQTVEKFEITKEEFPIHNPIDKMDNLSRFRIESLTEIGEILFDNKEFNKLEDFLELIEIKNDNSYRYIWYKLNNDLLEYYFNTDKKLAISYLNKISTLKFTSKTLIYDVLYKDILLTGFDKSKIKEIKKVIKVETEQKVLDISHSVDSDTINVNDRIRYYTLYHLAYKPNSDFTYVTDAYERLATPIELEKILNVVGKINSQIISNKSFISESNNYDSLLLREVSFIFNFFYSEKEKENRNWYRVKSLKPIFINVLIDIFFRTNNLKILANKLRDDWFQNINKEKWSNDDIRLCLNKLKNLGYSDSFIRDCIIQLNKATPTYNDISGIINEKKAQAYLLYDIGEHQLAKDCIQFILTHSIAVGYRKDFQFNDWLEWLQKEVDYNPTEAKSKIIEIAKRIYFLRESTEVAGYRAVNKLLNICSQWNLYNGVKLFKWYLKNKLISFEDGVEILLLNFIKQDDTRINLYYDLFFKILAIFGDNTDANILELLYSKLGDNNLSKILEDIDKYVIQEHKPQMLYKIEKIYFEKYGKLLDIDFKRNVDDYKCLKLKDGRILNNVQAKIEINSFEKIANYLTNDDRHNSSFDWRDFILTCNVILSVEQILNLKDISEGKLSIGSLAEIAIKNNHHALAKNLLETELPNILQTEKGWLSYYDGGKKIKFFKSAVLIAENDYSPTIFKAFTDDLFKYGYFHNVLLAYDEILPLINNKDNYHDHYLEVEKLIHALLINAKPDDDICEFEDNKGISDAISLFVDMLLDFPIEELRLRIIEIIRNAYLNKENIETILNTLIIQNKETDVIKILLTLKNEHLIERFNTFLKTELNSKNFFNAITANELLNNFSSLPKVLKKENEPLVYKIDLPNQSALTIDANERLEFITERQRLIQSQNPIEIIGIYDYEVKYLEKICGIKKINIATRIVHIMNELKQNSEWNSDAEKKIREYLDAIDLKFSYPRPQYQLAKTALLHVIRELYDLNYLSESVAQDITNDLEFFDPEVFNIPIQNRPKYINYLIEDEKRRVASFNKEWIEKLNSIDIDKNFADNVDGWKIITEFTKLKSLTWGHATEYRVKLIRLNPSIATLETLHEYRNALPIESFEDIEDTNSLIIISQPYMYSSNNLINNWMSINPTLGLALNWHLIDNINWSDEDGNLMIKSVFWMDGYPYRYSRNHDSEAAMGWLVFATPEAIKQIDDYFKNHNLKVYCNKKIFRKFHDDTHFLKNEVQSHSKLLDL